MPDATKIIFRPNKWLKLIEQFQDSLIEKNNITMFCAQPGCGKSTFAEILKQNMPEHYSVMTIKAVSSLKINKIVQNLKKMFQHEIKNLESFVKLVNDNKTHILLIIDDANLLSEEILKNINQFFEEASDDNKYFHLALITEYEIPMHNSIVFQLGNLSLVETTTYIKFLAKKHRKSPTNKQIQHIFAETSGKISEINNYLKTMNASDVKTSHNIFSKLLIVMSILFGGFFVGYGRYILSQDIVTVSVTSKIETPSLVVLIPYYVKIIKANINYRNHVATASVSTVEVTPPKIKHKKIKKNKVTNELHSDDKYTIQLIASKNINDIKDFIENKKLSSEAKIKILEKNGINWYVAVIGTYKNLTEANLALKKLNISMKYYKPWPRALQDLKALS